MSRERQAARRRARLERWCARLAEARERARLGAAEAGDQSRGREPLLHRHAATGARRRDHEPEPAQVGGREARVVEDAEPDRLEGGEGDRARSSSSWSSAAPARSAPSGREAHEAASAPARTSMLPTWKNGSGVQKRSSGPRPSRSANRSPSAMIAEVAVDAALRVRGRARRCRASARRRRPEPRPAPQRLGGVDGGGPRGELGVVRARRRRGTSPARRPPRAAPRRQGR